MNNQRGKGEWFKKTLSPFPFYFFRKNVIQAGFFESAITNLREHYKNLILFLLDEMFNKI
jgi:hypothetical protein